MTYYTSLQKRDCITEHDASKTKWWFTYLTMTGHAIQRSPKINTIYPPTHPSIPKCTIRVWKWGTPFHPYPIPSMAAHRFSLRLCQKLEVRSSCAKDLWPEEVPWWEEVWSTKRVVFISQCKNASLAKNGAFDSISPTFTSNSFGFTNRNAGLNWTQFISRNLCLTERKRGKHERFAKKNRFNTPTKL